MISEFLEIIQFLLNLKKISIHKYYFISYQMYDTIRKLSIQLIILLLLKEEKQIVIKQKTFTKIQYSQLKSHEMLHSLAKQQSTQKPNRH